MALFLLVVFIILMLIGMPIGFSFVLTALFGFFYLGDPAFLTMLSQKFFSGMNSFALLALPFFILAGDIMNKVKLTDRLVDFSNIFFGRLRGGLAQVNIVTSIIFGGMSGSGAADTAALGSIFIPSMTKEGYDKDFSTAVTVSSSMIAPIIPPSIIMVIYGSIMGESIAALFAAGIAPGLMIGLGLMIVTRIISGQRNYPKSTEKVTLRRLSVGTGRAIWALIMPVIILGGIGLIISSAGVLGWLLAIEQIPEMVAGAFLSITNNKYVILLLINLFLLFIGMFMDITASLILLAPIMAPLAISVGIDPLHFGIMMCLNLDIALMTPPMGGCLFIAMAITRLSLGQIVKALFPFLLVELFILFLVVYIPEITMFIPRLLGFID